jgi:fused signal recognition particle receptor
MTGIGRRLRELFQPRGFDEGFFDELEDVLIEADMGVRIASETVGELKSAAREKRLASKEELLSALRDRLRACIVARDIPLLEDSLNVLLVLGVNGVGKTTTIAKLAHYYRTRRGIEKIMLVAGDTFRAAAIDQLRLLGNRLDMPVIAQEQGADPGAVVFDGIASAAAKGYSLVIADTAGRLHNRDALVKELSKIDKIVRARVADGGYRKVLVLDATTGQNSLAQAEVFHRAVGIDSIVLAKFDSTAKGGMVVPICRGLGIPFSFVGLGEKLDELEAFDVEAYLDSLLSGS